MKTIPSRFALLFLVFVVLATYSLAQQEYPQGPDSKPQAGVPEGKLDGQAVVATLETIARRQTRPRGLDPGTAKANGDTVEVNLTQPNARLAEQLANPSMGIQAPGTTAGALLQRCRCLLEAGDIEGADRALEGAERLADDLAQPTLRWLVGPIATTRTILAGDLDEGERRARAGFELGQSTGQGEAARRDRVDRRLRAASPGVGCHRQAEHSRPVRLYRAAPAT